MTKLMAACAFALAGQAGADRIATGKGDLTIHPIQHATFVMKWDGRAIYVDPVGGPAPFKDHPRADLILITDIHGDHLSAETVAGVWKPETVIVAPAAVAERFPEGSRSRVTVLANGASTKWQDAVIEAVPMYNLTADRLRYHAKGRGNGYVLALGGKRVYISGDTEDIPEMRKLPDSHSAVRAID